MLFNEFHWICWKCNLRSNFDWFWITFAFAETRRATTLAFAKLWPWVDVKMPPSQSRWHSHRTGRKREVENQQKWSQTGNEQQHDITWPWELFHANNAPVNANSSFCKTGRHDFQLFQGSKQIGKWKLPSYYHLFKLSYFTFHSYDAVAWQDVTKPDMSWRFWKLGGARLPFDRC